MEFGVQLFLFPAYRILMEFFILLVNEPTFNCRRDASILQESTLALRYFVAEYCSPVWHGSLPVYAIYWTAGEETVSSV